jgi:hypothetical protein
MKIPFNLTTNRNIELILPNGSVIELEYRTGGTKGNNAVFVGVSARKMVVEDFGQRSIIITIPSKK